MMKLTMLSPLEVKYIVDYLEELDALIEGDDGTLFPLKLVEVHDTVKDMIHATTYRK